MDQQRIAPNASKKNFMNHVFKFDDDSKNEVLNTLQYLIMAIVLVSVLHTFLSSVMPEVAEEKGNVELLGETLVHAVAFFVGLFLIDRIITYVPSYSGVEYKPLNMITLALVFVALQLDSNSVLGNKIKLLAGRVNAYINGGEEISAVKNKKHAVEMNSVGANGARTNTSIPTRMGRLQNIAGNGYREGMREGSSSIENVAPPQQQQQQQQGFGNGGGFSGNDFYGPLPDMMSPEPVAANSIGFQAF